MVILSASQIRQWDQYTIQQAPISSIDLMENAAAQIFKYLQNQGLVPGPYLVFCGKGNNGGDGLALARMLARQGSAVAVHILELGKTGTPDFQENLARLHETPCSIHYIQSQEHFPMIEEGSILIDALFGTGLNRPVSGLAADLILFLNQAPNLTISLDIPSGMLPDQSSKSQAVIQADHTLTFQCLKYAFLMAENESFYGNLEVVEIGLLPGYLNNGGSHSAQLVEPAGIRTLIHSRPRFAHKGNFGHAGILAGSYGMMGAAILSAKACLRSGVGKVTCHLPSCGYEIIQTAVPEAMAKVETGSQFPSHYTGLEKYQALGIGPGIGRTASHKTLLEEVLLSYRKPMVIDADALNILAENPGLMETIPSFSLLTPHPAEFDRLFAPPNNDFDRMQMAIKKAHDHNLIIILKGHRTLIAMPGGRVYFNSTGNPGMATGGSGDVLTGILTGLLAQGLQPEEAALLGVFLHGWAGDLAAKVHTESSLIASDIIDYLGQAYKALEAI